MARRDQGHLERATDCPICKHKLTAWTAMESGTQPKPGDLTICVYCSAVLEFTEGLNMQAASAEVVAEYMLEISRTQRIVREFRKTKKKRERK